MNRKITNPISTAELKRRWSALRSIMTELGVDVLLAQNSNEFHGGYVKWLTDKAARHASPTTVIFPRDEPMTIVQRGAGRGEIDVPLDDDENRGVGKIWTVDSNAAVDYTKSYAAEVAVQVLRPWTAGGTIGLVGTQAMSYPFLEHLKSALLSNTRFIDMTDQIDGIKAIKSDEELTRVRQTAAMQDAVLEEVMKAVRPGMKLFELTALAQYHGQLRGSEQGIFLAGVASEGASSRPVLRHSQGQALQAGDVFSLLIENNGPGGFYTELGRTCVLGRAGQKLLEEHAFTLEAQRHTLERLKPEADPREIREAHGRFMLGNGRPEDLHLYAHGQGYDMVERPTMTFDETMRIAAGMQMAVHPGHVVDDVFSWISDNYLVTEEGVCEESLHKTPQKIFELCC
jgi:Xaa-Pro aminopeptidase